MWTFLIIAAAVLCQQGRLADSEIPFVALDCGTQKAVMIALPDVGVAPDQLSRARQLYQQWRLAPQQADIIWRITNPDGRNRFGDLSSDLTGPSGQQLQQQLVQAGIMLPLGRGPVDFWAALDRAQGNTAGLWAAARPASQLFRGENAGQNAPHLLVGQAIGRWAYIHAKIESVGDSRGRIYLNFGSSWRRDLTIEISPKHWREFYQSGWRTETLAGSCVAAYGWFAEKNGPYLKLASAAQLRLLAEKKCRRSDINSDD